jgi:5-methylcytosine-specific restriction enzyme A
MPIVDLNALEEANLQELGKLALMSARTKVPGKSATTIYRVRSEAIRLYVLRRADGLCEGCGQQAPFLTGKGAPYLEAHHTARLADEGPDHPKKAIAPIVIGNYRGVHIRQEDR